MSENKSNFYGMVYRDIDRMNRKNDILKERPLLALKGNSPPKRKKVKPARELPPLTTLPMVAPRKTKKYSDFTEKVNLRLEGG